MTRPDSNAKTERVLVHAPFGRDATMICEALERAGMNCSVCADVDCVLTELQAGAGALLIADEALNRDTVAKLALVLADQPHWSDLPVLVMTSGGEATDASQFRLKMAEPLGNVTLLERPLRIVTLLSAVQTALRARRRQYEISDFLRERDALLAQAQASERIYRGIGESIDFGIWICTPDGRNVYASESFLKLVGLTQQQCSGFGWAEVLHPDDAGEAVESWKRCVARGIFWDRNYRFHGVDGEWHHVLSRGVPIRGPEDEILCWAGINLDIGRVKEIENALRRSNADLEQFAYAASHDLQEPLRNVAIFTQLLGEKYSGQLDASAAEFISIIVNSAKRMEMLIQDLLVYTRATNLDEVVREETDVEAVLAKLLCVMQPLISEQRASITSDPLPQVRVHEVHLQQLFQNLLVNAIKYRSKEPPRLHISAKSGTEWLFSFRDNGIGIDPQYATQIFGIFKRLHHSDQYPGTGMGLAICQKIVERYGGRIWVESELGKGATFFFTLPV